MELKDDPITILFIIVDNNCAQQSRARARASDKSAMITHAHDDGRRVEDDRYDLV